MGGRRRCVRTRESLSTALVEGGWECRLADTLSVLRVREERRREEVEEQGIGGKEKRRGQGEEGGMKEL